MVKHIALVTAKSGQSRDAFIDRYENGHALLALRILPPGTYTDYRRNYLAPGPVMTLEGPRDTGDVLNFTEISEFWYPDRNAVDRLMKSLAETDAGQQITDDEAAFMDRSKITMIEADEHATPDSDLMPRPAAYAGDPAVKLVALVSKRKDITREQFIDLYENSHAPLALELLRKNGKSIFAGYRRSYPVPGDLFKLPHVEYVQPPVDFDVLSEFWFWTERDFDDFLAMNEEPDYLARMTPNQETLFDMSSIRMFRVEEYRTPSADLDTMGSQFTRKAEG